MPPLFSRFATYFTSFIFFAFFTTCTLNIAADITAVNFDSKSFVPSGYTVVLSLCLGVAAFTERAKVASGTLDCSYLSRYRSSFFEFL
jgi:hypothetical protein